ncbi:MAG: ABC-ATPase domain-containing protein [Verrucomicrobiota bacterium]
MMTQEDLRRTLQRIDGKGYKAYNDIKGEYNFTDYNLIVEHVQGDPFAAPSKIRLQLPQATAGFPVASYNSASREIALRDFLARRFSDAIRKLPDNRRGSGKSGTIRIDCPGQEVLERSCVIINEKYLEVRFFMGLPAFGRKIAGRQAEEMFFKDVVNIAEKSLYYDSLDHDDLFLHIETVEDADFLRSHLPENGLLAFVADGAILPRASGIDARAMAPKKAVAFESPNSMRVEFDLPNRGIIRGMGIKKGVNLIIGGGYHGKSTLLNALELGVYNHIPGDGREFVITEPEAAKIRAEDGRNIAKVDISPFINNLPFNQETTEFVSENASGSTSQAANIIEALEAGATTLMIDEDTSATNFMIRDHRMQELVAKDNEPITPFIDKVRQLADEQDVSTVLVIGGSGDYFDVADNVICMMEYLPYDFTDKAKGVAEKHRAEREKEGGSHFGSVTHRLPHAASIDPSRGNKKIKIKCGARDSIQFGRENIDLNAVEQLADMSQTRAIADTIWYARKYMDGSTSLRQIIERVTSDIEENGLDVLNRFPAGDYAAFRKLELAAAVNRLRTLEVNQKPSRSFEL